MLCIPMLARAESNGTYSIEDYLTRTPNNTECATKIFNNALRDNANMIAENIDDASSIEIETWTHSAFSQASVLSAVLECPELKKANDDDTIVFETVSYKFPPSASYPQGRLIQINYETQKKVLEQRLLLANKPQLTSGDISPDIVKDIEAGNIWVNVDPAWYAIMVAEHGTLDQFVGPDKTNIVSADYIEQNIGTLYPKDHNNIFKANCTSKTAMAEDIDMINRAVTITVGGRPAHKARKLTEEEKEQLKTAKRNDYYVMGDGDLRWIAVAEIVADAVLSVVTWGGYQVVKGTLMAARAARVFRKARTIMKNLQNTKEVARWIKTSSRAQNIEQAIKTADNIEDSYKLISKVDRTTSQTVKKLTKELDLLRSQQADPKAIRALEQELAIATKQANAASDAFKTADRIKDIEKTLKNPVVTDPKITALEEKIKLLEKQRGTKMTRNTHGYQEYHDNIERQINQLQHQIDNRKLQLRQQGVKLGNMKPEEIEKLQTELAELKGNYSTQLSKLKGTHADEIALLEQNADVMTYKNTAKAQRDAAHTVYLMRQGKRALQADRGLLPMRAVRGWKQLRKGIKSAKNLDKSAKLVRANTSGVSAKINDWLFHSTLKNMSALTKVPAQLQTLKMFVKIAGEMYDWTEVSTSDFTNNIEMSAYLLLAADDLEGYEDVINEGMWLFWTGSSTSAADDDAAFLQAMSFAEKFHQDLVEVQDEYNVMSCDVDIYVVRPIIRNPGTEQARLYFLFMNSTPWTTHGYNEPNDGSEQAGIALKDGVSIGTGGVNNYAGTGYAGVNGFENDGGDQYTAYYTPNINADGSISGTLNKIGHFTEPRYDGSRIGQPCTKPSTKGGVFTNEILTSGRYASISPAFEKAMITKFRTEGGCGFHPADRGGYTCYGVSSNFFSQVKNPGFSRKDAEDIAWNVFFKGHNLDKLPDAISGDVFMALWGTGSKKYSIGLLQKLLGVPQTNVVDNATVEAAINYPGADLRTRFLDIRGRAFSRGQKEFRRGWLNGLDLYRANGCHTVAD